jgi:hypothetical protein
MKRLYLKVCRIVALMYAKQYDGRKDFEDADRLYRWLTEYYEK